MTATHSHARSATADSTLTAQGTLPGLVAHQAQQRPKGVALRKKERGIWQPTTWQGYLDSMRSVALGLQTLGVGAGDAVGILAENEPAWLYADLGAQSAGAMSVAAYPAQSADEVIYIMAQAKCRVIFCADQEQVDKVRDNRASLPDLDKIVAFNMSGVFEYEDASIVSFADLVKAGADQHASDPGRFAELLAALSPDDIALVSYTSGTTGAPKGAMLRHRDEVAMATEVATRAGLTPKDRDLCHFPLAHPAARVMDAYSSLVGGNSVNFPESTGTVPTDIVELNPTVILGTPRVFELMKADVELRINRAAWIKRKFYQLARAMQTSVLNHRLAGKKRVWDPILSFLAYWLVGRWVRNRLGLVSIRYASCVGSSVSSELLKFFWSLGVPIRATYGQAESSGIAFSQNGFDDINTTGTVMSCLEARVSDDGELQLRGDGLFTGYLADPVATAAVLLPDGWYRTGDVAHFESDNRLVVTDRQENVINTNTTTGISPSEIENQLRLSTYISDAMVIGDKRPNLTVLIQLEYESVAEWAQRQNLPFTTFRSLAESPDVAKLLDEAVSTANDSLPPEKRIAAYRLLPRELDPGQGELTATRKLKRDAVATSFADLIEDMYRDGAAPASSTAG